MPTRRLPTVVYNGKTYTRDDRLEEFRYLVLGEMPEFIPFDSPKGEEILERGIPSEEDKQ